MVRPSARCAVMRYSVTSTVRIRGSLLATVVIPCLQDTPQVLQKKGSNPIQCTRRKAMIGAQCNWGQPKLTHHTLVAYMDMRRFMAIPGSHTNRLTAKHTTPPCPTVQAQHNLDVRSEG